LCIRLLTWNVLLKELMEDIREAYFGLDPILNYLSDTVSSTKRRVAEECDSNECPFG
jgi:hypothetical protein